MQNVVSIDASRRNNRPSRRRDRRKEVALFRVHAALIGSAPMIWRRIDVRSDSSLDVLHQVLQAAYQWEDRHLFRFALGGGPWEPTAELFLCEFDVREGEDEGAPASNVRIDETLGESGDLLRYVYDYGDGWEIEVRLEDVLPAVPDSPIARCIAGERAAPPEDCGHRITAEELADVVDDPALFDPSAVNVALRDHYFVLTEHQVQPELVDLVHRLAFSDDGPDISRRASQLVAPLEKPADFSDRLAPFRWFLERAGEAGIPLTAAGYLKPADVAAAGALLPTMAGWIGKNNRENHSIPVLDFRESLTKLGLLRKHKGSLQLTKAGKAALASDDVLIEHLCGRFITGSPRSFDQHASLLIALVAATSPEEPFAFELVSRCLTDIGWRTDGRAVNEYDLYWIPTLRLLQNLSNPEGRRGTWLLSTAAAWLARTAVVRGRN